MGRVFLAYSVTVDIDDSADRYQTEYIQWAFFVVYTCMMSLSAQYSHLTLLVFKDERRDSLCYGFILHIKGVM